MSELQTPKMWMDLTVPNATEVRDFYQHVAGMAVSPVSMGDYEDYVMLEEPGGAAVGGVCHARGSNAELPPVWLPYFVVKNLDVALAEVPRRGGVVVGKIRSMGESSRYCLVRDPGGAHCMLFQKE